MPILPPGLSAQLHLRPGTGGEPRSRERREIHRRHPLEDPCRERVSQRGRNRKPRDVTAARKEEASHRRRRPDDMLAIGRHRRNPPTMLPNWRLQKHRQLLLDVGGVSPERRRVECQVLDLELLTEGAHVEEARVFLVYPP